MSTSTTAAFEHQHPQFKAERLVERPRIMEERRRFKRMDVSLNGRFMVEDTKEYPCEVFNMSPEGMAVRAPFSPRFGERVISYIDHLGGFDGNVAGTFDGGFAVEFKISARKRERIANVLTWYESGDHKVEDRVHERLAPPNPSQKLILPTGTVGDCHVIDVSFSGASVATRLRPDLNTLLMLGRLRGRVVRHHDQGFAIEFVEIQDPDNLARTFG